MFSVSTFTEPLDRPTHTLLNVLLFNFYIPLGSLLVGFSVSCWMVFVALNAMLRL